MQLAEGQETVVQVVDFLHCTSNSLHDFGSMQLDRTGARAQVFPVGKVDLGLGVRHQEPEKKHKEVIK